MAAPYTTFTDTRPRLGLIALQADRTMEDDFRRLMPRDVSLLVSRVPSGTEVTADSLAQMEGALTGAAALFPRGHKFDVVGYGCTSGTAQIGARVIGERVRAGCDTAQVSEPVSALIAACAVLDLQRIAIVSPYVAAVSDRLRHVLRAAGIDTPRFTSFDEASEAAVTQIDGADVQGLFLSCTNLNTLDVIAPLQAELGLPVLSSNLVLAWHMMTLAGVDARTPRDLL